MAVIHDTTMSPSKLELVAAWLPEQPWYAGNGTPELAKAGGFRLDDPAGEVGIEFMVVTDTSGDRPVSYHVPMTYRGAPLDGADDGLVGTSEHGVLGRRWVYDGPHDPVFVAELLALVQGRAAPQHQTRGDTPEPSVTSHFTGRDRLAMAAPASVTSDRDGTEIVLGAGPAGTPSLAVTRVLAADRAVPSGAVGHVEAAWTPPGDVPHRTPFTVLYLH